MKKRITCVAALVLGMFLPSAYAVEFTTPQLDKSKITFTFKQMGVGVDGSFKRFTPKVVFDPVKPEKASASIEIDLAGIDAGSTEANDEVKNPAWFNTKTYPTARFVANTIRAVGGGKYEMVGMLTIKGRAKETIAPLLFKQEGNLGVFDGAFVLKRADFAIGEGEWSDFGVVANEIQIRFHVVASAAAK